MDLTSLDTAALEALCAAIAAELKARRPTPRAARVALLLDLYRLRMSDLWWDLGRADALSTFRADLPDADGVPPRAFAEAVDAACQRTPGADEALLAVLLRARPGRATDIRAVWGA